MKRATLTTIILMLLSISAFAQSTITGSVKNTDGEAVSFANVTLYYQSDTTKIYGGTITDFNGNYALKDIKSGDYQLVLSAIGIKTQSLNISLTESTNLTKDFTAEEDSKILSEVVVKDYRTKNFTDHKEFTFSKQQIEKAYDAKELMKNINGIKIDPTTGSFKSNKSGEVKVLIASENDLKQLTPDKIAKVEYYTIPPARYADAGSVLNVITKEQTNGISGGVDLTHALTTGFIDDMIYFNAVKGNSRFSLSYSVSLRDFKNRFNDEKFDYSIGDKNYTYNQYEHDNFGYTEHTPVLKYTYTKPKNITFQATLTPDYLTSFSDATSDVDFFKGSTKIKGNSISKSNEETFGPSLDIYLSKNINEKQEISVDLVGTYYDLTQKENENGVDVADNSSIISDNMHLTNKKKSLIGELAYKINFNDNYSFSTGYKGTFANSDFKISNILSDYQTYRYNSYNENDYLYGELSGSASDDLSFRISAGATYVKNENDDEKYNKWLFTPQFVLSYDISETQNISLELKSKPKIPSISKLSSNAELVIPYVLRTGNPKLKTANFYELNLDYTLSSDRFDIDFALYYEHEHNAINSYYTYNKYDNVDYIFSISQNAKYFKDYGISYDISYYPFDDIDLTINVYGYVGQQELKSNIIGNHTNLYVPFYYDIDYSVGNFEIEYSGNIPSMQINGSYLGRDENQSDLLMSYTFNNNIKITVGCYWLFTKAKYETETLSTSLLNCHINTHITDTKSMFVLGFAWNFSKGKSINVKQTLQNKDNDKGSF